MKKAILNIILFNSLILNLSAQVNLVPNYSFEDTLQCPFFSAQINFAPPWYDPTSASSDYFNNCNSGNLGVPTNIVGFQFARTGKAYAGIYTYIQTFSYRDYIQVSLISSLLSGKKYNVEFYVSLADTMGIATNNIGLYFSDIPITASAGSVLNVPPQVANDIVNVKLTDKNGWTKISGSYIANGTEQYITIGNFLNDMSVDTVHVIGVSYPFSYYYIDDVSVVCFDCNDVLIPNIFTPNNDGVNDYFEIKNLPDDASTQIFNRWGIKVFETNKSNVFWDGRTTSGNELVDGTYFYLVTSEEEIYKGFLQLIR